MTRVGFGDVEGYERFSLWGRNPSVDSGSVPRVIGSLGSVTPPYMSAATSLEIVSDNAADTAAGTGARTVRLDALDANYNRIGLTVTLNGTTAVAFDTQVIAVQMATVVTVGSSSTNAGTLTIRDAGAGTTRLKISAGVGVSQNTARTVPAGYTLQLRHHLFSITRGNGTLRYATISGAFQLWDGAQHGPVVYPLDVSVSDSAPTFFQAEPGLILPERSRYWHAVRSVSANGVDISSSAWGVLRLNTAP